MSNFVADPSENDTDTIDVEDDLGLISKGMSSSMSGSGTSSFSFLASPTGRANPSKRSGPNTGSRAKESAKSAMAP
jgi:hypothetical protein